MATMCNSCSKPLRGSKYYEVICRDATEHQDRIKEVDEMQNKSRRSEEHEKEKMIEEVKKALRKLTSEELDEEEEKLREEIAQLRAEIEDLDPDKKDEELKKSKSAMAEYIGIDNHHSAGVDLDTAVESLTTLQRHRKKKLKYSQSYNVLTLEPYESVKHSGDELFIRLGSTDEPTKGNAKDDEFLKSLGSVD